MSSELKTLHRSPGSYRVFLHQDGRIALAGPSAADPWQTDDGVFWLDTSRSATIRMQKGGPLLVEIPVLEDRYNNRPTTITAAQDTSEFLKQYGLQVKLNRADKAFLSSVLALETPDMSAPLEGHAEKMDRALAELIWRYENLLVNSRITKRDAAEMLATLPHHTGAYRALLCFPGRPEVIAATRYGEPTDEDAGEIVTDELAPESTPTQAPSAS